MNNLNCRRDTTEILLKAAYKYYSINQSIFFFIVTIIIIIIIIITIMYIIIILIKVVYTISEYRYDLQAEKSCNKYSDFSLNLPCDKDAVPAEVSKPCVVQGSDKTVSDVKEKKGV